MTEPTTGSPERRQEFPVGAISPLGQGYHRTGPGAWHEHYEYGHSHKGGEFVHLKRADILRNVAAEAEREKRFETRRNAEPRRFERRPVVIEAMQLTPDSLVTVANWCHAKAAGKKGLIIRTLEGFMKAEFGDWVIRGVKGEFYPCKPDIFKETYDEAF